MYGWRSYDAPSFLRKKGITDTFKPPELKNYPVQGTGGEIVQMIIGRLWRVFMKKNNWGGKALLVNTVHDCIWVDCHEDVLEEVASVIKKVMESVPQMLEKIFGIHCPVPFPVDVEAGLNMLDLHHVNC
jgi:DNA polymerase I-like protein with 3'-5' exonuclease and polymerase domains